MFSAMHFISFAEELSDTDRQAQTQAIQEAADAVSPVNLVAVPHEATNSGGGDLICKLGFADQDEYEAAKEGVDAPDAIDCVHRVLMFADQERAKPEDVARLNELCTQFHVYVPGMLNWRVADIVESSGSKKWAHIWEQDFDSVGTFTGIYMFTPFHPTYVDTYFDTECPNWTADPELCTITCDESTAFLANYCA